MFVGFYGFDPVRESMRACQHGRVFKHVLDMVLRRWSVCSGRPTKTWTEPVMNGKVTGRRESVERILPTQPNDEQSEAERQGLRAWRPAQKSDRIGRVGD